MTTPGELPIRGVALNPDSDAGRDDVAVVGAGIAGLTAALRLVEAGLTVRVFERYPRPGGLARALEIGGEPIEAFYHHIFTSDTAYVALAEELGLGHTLEWLPSRMGIWTDGRLWDFGTPQALLRFKPLSLVDKLRFGLTTLLLQRIRDPSPFENVTAAECIQRYQGRRVWERVWGPLLYQKFAQDGDKVAMAWLWGKLRLRGGSRSKSGLGECLGYMRGSFARLVETLEQRLETAGASLHLSDAVKRIDTENGSFMVHTRRSKFRSERVLVAAPVVDYLEVAGHLLEPTEAATLRGLRSTAALCTVLELEQSLTPYYWLNIADPGMPFGGLIEHTNYISPDRYGGRHILYISNYMFPDHPLYRTPKREVLELYAPALRKINPQYDESWIRASHHFRAESAQPVVTVGYPQQIPAVRATVPGLYLCTMAQIYPEDRGQNYAIVYGEKTAAALLDDLRSA